MKSQASSAGAAALAAQGRAVGEFDGGNTMKRFTMFAVALALAAVLFGCGGGDDAGTDGATVVSFWHAMGGPLGDRLEELVLEFNETHADIRVESVSMGRYQALSQKIMAAVAAGEPPVLAQAYEAWTGELIENGSAEPLNDYIEGPNGLSQEELADFVPGMVENNTWDGTVYSFPFNKSVRALYWNRDLFGEEGLDRAPRNWDEYMDYARRLTKDQDGDGEPDQWGTAGQISAWMFENLLIQNGGRILTPDGTRAAFNGPQGVEALRFMVKLLTDYGKVTSGYEYQNDFQAGKVAMIEGSTVSLSFMEGKYTFDLALAPLPEKEREGCFVAGTNVVIFSEATDAEKRAAWEFIKWFVSPEITARWAAGTGYAPVRMSAMQSDAMLRRFEEIDGLREVYGQLEFASYEPRSGAWYAGRKYLEETAVESALREQASPEEALEMAARAVNAELESERRSKY
ncbi:MAG: extracellular solute-binding protein [Candidatus Eisenbacteria bacterium]|nr:extracellular solute-binding protein [Candidatus Eisenbacteria bacterium]